VKKWKRKYNFLPRVSEELYPTFKVDDKAFTLKAYDKRTPGLFKVDLTKDKMVSLCSKCIVVLTSQKTILNYPAKSPKKDNNNVNYKNFMMYYQ
jgi:hypothetical protein